MIGKNRISSSNIQELKDDEIFVFGSNIQGRHAAGAAKFAMDKFGAKYGIGIGITGRSYAIPTVDYGPHSAYRNVVKIKVLERYIYDFIAYARRNSNKRFLVTEIGCGLAGYTPIQIAPLFIAAKTVKNIHLPESFVKILNN